MQIRGFWWDLRMKSWKWWKIQCHEQIKYAWNHAPYGGLYSFLHSEKGLLWKNPTVSHPQYHLTFSPNIFSESSGTKALHIKMSWAVTNCLETQTVWELRWGNINGLKLRLLSPGEWCSAWATGIVFFLNPQKNRPKPPKVTPLFLSTHDCFFTLNVFEKGMSSWLQETFLRKV